MGFQNNELFNTKSASPQMPTITILNNDGDDDGGDGSTMRVRQSWAKNENL